MCQSPSSFTSPRVLSPAAASQQQDLKVLPCTRLPQTALRNTRVLVRQPSSCPRFQEGQDSGDVPAISPPSPSERPRCGDSVQHPPAITTQKTAWKNHWDFLLYLKTRDKGVPSPAGSIYRRGVRGGSHRASPARGTPALRALETLSQPSRERLTLPGELIAHALCPKGSSYGDVFTPRGRAGGRMPGWGVQSLQCSAEVWLHLPGPSGRKENPPNTSCIADGAGARPGCTHACFSLEFWLSWGRGRVGTRNRNVATALEPLVVSPPG